MGDKFLRRITIVVGLLSLIISIIRGWESIKLFSDSLNWVMVWVLVFIFPVNFLIIILRSAIIIFNTVAEILGNKIKTPRDKNWYFPIYSTLPIAFVCGLIISLFISPNDLFAAVNFDSIDSGKPDLAYLILRLYGWGGVFMLTIIMISVIASFIKGEFDDYFQGR